jgi:hypothetical protein
MINDICCSFHSPNSLWVKVVVDADCYAKSVEATVLVWSEKEKKFIDAKTQQLECSRQGFRKWDFESEFNVALSEGAIFKVFAKAICHNCRTVIDSRCFTIVAEIYEDIIRVIEDVPKVDCKDFTPLECLLPGYVSPYLDYNNETGDGYVRFNILSYWKKVEVKWYLWVAGDWVLKDTHLLTPPVFSDTYHYGALNPGDKIRVEIRGQCADDLWSEEIWSELEI